MTYNGTAQNQVGPVESKLHSFGEVIGLVVGQMGECSQGLHDLLLSFAEEKFQNLNRTKGMSLGKDMHSLIIQQVRRRFSVCAIRAQSACLLSRLSHFSQGACLAAQRRAHFSNREEASKVDLRIHWEANVRGRRLNRTGLLHI